MKLVAVWLLPITALLVLGTVNMLMSMPVLFTKYGLRKPPVMMDELKKLVGELPL
jgi:hypothetical protein